MQEHEVVLYLGMNKTAKNVTIRFCGKFVVLYCVMSQKHAYLNLCNRYAVTSFNRKLKELVKAHHHSSLLETDTNRKPYTTHGLHLNGQGKERLANQIVSHILSVLEQSEGPPILDHHPVLNEIVRNLEEESDKLNCSPDVLTTTGTDCQKYQHRTTQEKTNSENTTVGAELTVNIAEEIISSTESNRSSSHTKRIPTTRSHEFLWET